MNILATKDFLKIFCGFILFYFVPPVEQKEGKRPHGREKNMESESI
jgi:hypothetical protein